MIKYARMGLECRWGTLTLLTTYFVLLSTVLHGNELPARAKEPHFLCKVSVQNLNEYSVHFDCTVKANGPDNLLVLTSPLTLEGPRSEQSLPKRHTGGDRCENVLEFDRGITEFDEGNIAFDPDIVPGLDEIAAMLKLPEGVESTLMLEWKPEPMLLLLPGSWWTTRLKLVFTSERRLSWLQSRPYFSSDCPSLDLQELARNARSWEGVVTFNTRDWQSGRRPDFGSCEQLFSLIFQHVYSNHVSFDLGIPVRN